VRGQIQRGFQPGFQIRDDLGQPVARVVVGETFAQPGAPGAGKDDRQEVVDDGRDFIGRRQRASEDRFAGLLAHAQDAAGKFTMGFRRVFCGSVAMGEIYPHVGPGADMNRTASSSGLGRASQQDGQRTVAAARGAGGGEGQDMRACLAAAQLAHGNLAKHGPLATRVQPATADDEHRAPASHGRVADELLDSATGCLGAKAVKVAGAFRTNRPPGRARAGFRGTPHDLPR
jgi:hypothetical protein